MSASKWPIMTYSRRVFLDSQSQSMNPRAQGREHRVGLRSEVWQQDTRRTRRMECGLKRMRQRMGAHRRRVVRSSRHLYLNTLRSVASPSTLLPPIKTRFGAQFEAPYGISGLLWHTNQPMHRNSLWGFIQRARKSNMSNMCDTLFLASSKQDA